MQRIMAIHLRGHLGTFGKPNRTYTFCHWHLMLQLSCSIMNQKSCFINCNWPGLCIFLGKRKDQGYQNPISEQILYWIMKPPPTSGCQIALWSEILTRSTLAPIPKSAQIATVHSSTDNKPYADLLYLKCGVSSPNHLWQATFPGFGSLLSMIHIFTDIHLPTILTAVHGKHN